METRANYVWVGVVTLLLLAATAIFFVWLAQLGTADRKQYDIFFSQSVGGLANGSTVTFSGVPSGQVDKIELWPQDPQFVRVRVSINKEVPILQGTVASISASFTGVSNVTLDGAVRGAPPITEPGPGGVPVIPAKPGGIGEILASAPLLLERLATLTDRLTRVLDDDNQESIAGILANTDKISGDLAVATPQIELTMVELRRTLAQSTETLAAFEGTLTNTNSLLQDEGKVLATEVRGTLRSAQSAADQLAATLEGVRPVTEELSRNTLPAANATMRDLRRTSASLRAITDRLETEGAGSLVGSNQLPDYKP